MTIAIRRFIDHLWLMEAGGQVSGSLELVQLSLKDARAFAETKFSANGMELDKEIPDFDKNFVIAQRLARLGKTQRKDMPVITIDDVRELQRRLKSGSIDVARPFYSVDTAKNPFPEGLSGEQAKEWLENGLKDGNMTDDIVSVSMKSIAIGELKPIQKQIYFDKSITKIAKAGSAAYRTKLAAAILITSSDKHIIDGHHKFLSGVLIDPKIKVNTLTINLPINKLLPLTLSYSDAIGNARNQ